MGSLTVQEWQRNELQAVLSHGQAHILQTPTKNQAELQAGWATVSLEGA